MPQIKKAEATFSIIYMIVFIGWWTTCFVLLLKGGPLWLLAPLVAYNVPSFPLVEDVMSAGVYATILAHAMLLCVICYGGFQEVRSRDVIVCGVGKDSAGDPAIRTNHGMFTIDDGTYNFGGRLRYIKDFQTIKDGFRLHPGLYRVEYHGQWLSQDYLNGAIKLNGAGQCG